MSKTTARGWLVVAGCLALACGDDTSSGDTTSAEGSSGGTTVFMDSGTTVEPTTGGSTAGSSTGADSTSEGSSSTTAGVCATEFPAIVTDIDETLTLSDAEFFMQIGDGNYDPVEREGAAELIGAYAELGYRVLYLTARSEDIVLEGTGETAREATERWLLEHGFPNDPETTQVVLSEMFVVGDTAQAYKADALMELQGMGWRFDYAYGNATSDIGAYADAGIDLGATFIIGDHAGEGGTVAVAGEGWVEHADMHLPTVPAVCQE
ncbi:LNS2 domain-containing protein [Paraliomyxa miuraensis]|uniref:LNS2 domain-containing protein n=1 Tax=Paraliomyxa miuraensis TaxID=376150 RepID=UPI002259605C|nr:hypothetical protein [Paraliomyxa miuraensis]MCX4243511.1 hypothetical protein [Paraliomyxa miuraensis]